MEEQRMKKHLTCQDLSQLRHLKKEIEILRRQIDDVESIVDKRIVFDVVEGSNPEWPYQKQSIRVEGMNAAEYDRRMQRLKARMRRRLEKLMRKLETLEKYIADVPDSEMRTILSLRYINGLSWQQIATHMGVAGDGSTERKRLNRFLKISRFS
jgi:hypothetical protein